MSEPSTPPSFIAIPALDNTFGALLIGTFLGLMLYGVLLQQLFRYSRLYTEDVVLLKVLVGTVIVLETFHTVISAHICYNYLVSNYFTPWNLLFGNWSIDLLPLSSGLVILTSQSFFARRVVAIGGKFRWIAGIAIVLFVGELAFYAAATVKAFMLPTFKDFLSVTWFISTGSAMAVTADFLLTSVLIISLRRSRTGFKQTDSTIDVLILFAVNTGLITGYLQLLACVLFMAELTTQRPSLCNILGIVFALILPSNLIYAAVGIVGTKLYATTLLAALNSRKSLVARGTRTFGLAQVSESSEGAGPSIALSIISRHTTNLNESRRTSCAAPRSNSLRIPTVLIEQDQRGIGKFDNNIHIIKPTLSEDFGPSSDVWDASNRV
ncbi:hypothetical protein L227DRAFT_615868 [Lentinus tigrinus ALCF2SS1-6]|uniref:DUF6534 domain-containing protein n=1 Tax=Lentinus tigrinus ALCF2SS1-6 TaxID=1328759 RepID=A0A5C2RW04_9APHY|nr:hypothetical protein L227DRAFT_615868 [Lentinus tigrinus ALCF2SS1-6]